MKNKKIEINEIFSGFFEKIYIPKIFISFKMNETIIRNDINETKDDIIVLQYLKDFKAKKCLYCFQSDEKFLCQCKDCGYYFCNNIHRQTSHAVLHLKQCKHKKISLSPFDIEILCKECRTKDIFALYFKDDQILCKDCLEQINCEDEFIKIIENKRINNQILMSPDLPPLANRFDSYSESLIARLNNKIILLKNFHLPTVSLNYTKKKKYCLMYNTLLENEKNDINAENMEEESFIFNLKFDSVDTSYIIAEITKKEQEFIFYPRQLLIVAKATNENKFWLARVIDIDKRQNKITIFFKDLDKCLKDGEYAIKEKESLASYDRIIDGLESLKMKNSNLFDKNILSLIIGKEIKEGKGELSNKNEYLDQKLLPKRLNISKLENIELNQSQEKAIKNCFMHKLTLIKGPPGTGKSTVLAFLAYHLLKLRKSSNDKIFIGAPSNRAVDNISFLLQKLGLKFIRVLSLEKEMTEDVDKTYSLEDLIKEKIEKEVEKNPKLKKIKELWEKRAKYGLLKNDDYEKYKKLIEEYQDQILNPSPIILSTINNSADSRISHYKFPIVIIDEATQALEPDCLLPLYHKAEMVIMIGDEKQLGPTVISKSSEIAGFGISLFERLSFYYNGSDFISTLNEQYRMHKSLYEFSNKHFYNNQMITHGDIQLDENVKNNFPWPNKDVPTFFYNIIDTEKNENCSYYNEKEIYHVYGVVHKLIKAGARADNIGIITPYNAQKYQLYDKFSNDKYDNLKIESVDGFQGMEKDYIIISTVRSNVSGKIGFLTSTKRLNVALTRAKKGVIILGNAECLAKKNGIWRDLISYYFSNDLIVQGPLSKLELVAREEIFIKDINSDEEEEKEIIKLEKHKEVKKEIASDYFKIWEPAPVAKNEIKENENNIENKSTEEEEKEIDNDKKDFKKKKKKNKKGKNNSDEEEEKKVEEEEKEECDKRNKKDKKKKDKNSKNQIEEIKDDKRNKKKNNKKNSSDSSRDESKEKKDKKKSKKNRK